MDVTERFLQYVAIGTNSEENSRTCPSTPPQFVLGKMIADELRGMGLYNVTQDENGYVYAVLPGKGRLNNADPIGFIAHLDTSPSVPGDNICPKKIKYRGGEIKLDDGRTVLAPSEYPELIGLKGETLIVTDGRTLLGADDKAGVAEIVTAIEEFAVSGETHRPVAIAFTPDEEIGRGADLFRLDLFGAKEAYTVDGGRIGGIEYENFNAASVTLKVNGVNIHPGSAKNRMKNSILMAHQFISMLPPAETPAHTEGYEGFYHICDMSGDETSTTIHMIIRDHDRQKFEARKRYIGGICNYLNGVWGEESFLCEIRNNYFNMKDHILPHMNLIEKAKKAFRAVEVEPFIEPVRGGTDGARLSYMGLPCPNLSTGGYNFHSCKEFIPVSSLEKMVKVIKLIAK